MKNATQKRSVRILAVWLVTALLASTAMVFGDVPGVIYTKDGGQRRGMIRWRPASKVYVITARGVSMKVKPSEVQSVKVRKPAELDQAIAKVKRGRHSSAIGTLETIMKKYAMLEWDVHAARWLAQAYLDNKDAQKAARMCEKVISSNPNAAQSPDFGPIYWEALLETKKFSTLKSALSTAIEKGGREMAAIAQVKRGDIDRKLGNAKMALVDGYLRTILMFQDVKHIQPEALYKAIKCHQELGEHHHAEKWRKRLLVEYPKDSYTKKLKSGI